MPDWKAFLKSLTESPRGFGADGRMMSLSLTAAMDEQRHRDLAEVEDYLRGDAATPRGHSTSA